MRDRGGRSRAVCPATAAPLGLNPFLFPQLTLQHFPNPRHVLKGEKKKPPLVSPSRRAKGCAVLG